MNSDDLIKYFDFDDLLYRDPNSEPFVILAGYETWAPPEHDNWGLHSQFIGYHSYMVNVEAKRKAFDELDYSQMTADISGFFEENSSDSVKSFLQILLRALFSRVFIDTIMPQSSVSLMSESS